MSKEAKLHTDSNGDETGNCAEAFYLQENKKLQDRLDSLEATYRVYGYMFQHEETGVTGWIDQYQLDNGWEALNPRLQVICPLYRKGV